MITVSLPHPPKSVRPNQGNVNIYKKAKAIRDYKLCAKAHAQREMSRTGMRPPKWARAKVEIIWKTEGVMAPDPDNIIASLKAAFDGLQQAGVVLNDRELYPGRPVILKNQSINEVQLIVDEDIDEKPPMQ